MGEVLQQGVLSGAQLDRVAAALHRLGGGVDLQVTDRQRRRLLPVRPAHRRPHAGQQLGPGEGLHHVVIGAHVQAAHSVVDAVACGEEHDRRRRSLLAKRLQDRVPVLPRQHDIQHHAAVGVGRRVVQRQKLVLT